MFPALLCAVDPNRISFPKLGLEFTVNSIAFTVFGLSITWYGVLITVGMLLAMFYGFNRMPDFGIDSDRAIDAVIGGVVGAVIGARAYYVLFHWSEYAGNWAAIVNIRKGGLAIYGGIIGALLIGSIVGKLRKVRLLPMYDVTAMGLLIGQCIGRWGNFTNHEAFGANTDWVTGMTSGNIRNWIALNSTDASLIADKPVHPCFFYESMWCLLGFILLHIISKVWRKFDGQLFLMYVLWYGSGRFFIEGLRTDSLYLGTIRVSQALALVSAVVALILLIIGFSHVKRMGTDYVLYVNSEESKTLLAETAAKEQAYREKRQKKAAKQEAEAPESHILLEDEEEAEEATVPTEETAAEPAELSEAEKQAAKSEKDAKIDALLDELAAKSKKKQ